MSLLLSLLSAGGVASGNFLGIWQPSNRLLEPEFEIRRTDHTLLHRYRSYPVFGSGPSEQPVKLVLLSPDLRPPDSTQVLFAMRAPATKAGAPWSVLFGVPSLRLEPEIYTVKTDTQALHRFRTTYQTVGQPWQSLFVVPPPRLEPEQDLARRVDPQLFYQYRPIPVFGGGPAAYPNQIVLLAPDVVPPNSTQVLFSFPRITAQAGGAPFFLLMPSPSTRFEAESYTVKSDQGTLHRYRTTYQTVGQAWSTLWPQPSYRLEPEVYTVKTDVQSLHRFRTTYQTVGQSWRNLFVVPPLRLEAEAYTVKTDQQALHRFRTTYQTVGQPWNALFTASSLRLEPEAYVSKSVDQTLLYGRVSVVGPSNQPWNLLWPQLNYRLEPEVDLAHRIDLGLLHQYRSFPVFGAGPIEYPASIRLLAADLVPPNSTQALFAMRGSSVITIQFRAWIGTGSSPSTPFSSHVTLL